MALPGAVWSVSGRLAKLAHSDCDSHGYRRQASRLIADAVPFDSVWWWTTDPANGFFTSGYLDPVPSTIGCGEVHANEFVEPDYNKFRVLARRDRQVGILSQETDGHLERSARFRHILEPTGFHHELRVPLLLGADCWGALTLLRTSASPDFAAADAETVAEFVKPLAQALRVRTLRDRVAADCTSEGPGLLILDSRDRTLAITPAGQRWLDELDCGPAGLPEAVTMVAACVRVIEDQGPEVPTPRARVKTGAGRWVVVHGSRVQAGNAFAGGVAVIIEEANPSDIAPLICQAYGLTERETDLARLLLRGQSTKEIAGELFLSPHTVQDHLKSVFEKTGVRSRRELVARITDQRAGSGLSQLADSGR